MSSTSRNYMAITPEPTNFSIPRKASIPSGLNTSPSRHHSEDYEESSIVEEGDVISQIHSWLALAKDAMQRNTGLLLVLAAQAFFALMNVSVKMLNNIPSSMALIGVLGQSAASTTIRAIGMRAHPMHSIAFYSLMCVVGSTVGIIVTKTPVIIPTRIEWLVLLIMIGIFGFVAQLLLTMGLQRETAGRSSMAIYTQIVFATILEKLIFNAVPPALSIAGTLLIIASAIYVVLTKKKQDISNPQDIDPSRTSELEEGLLSSSRQGHNGYNSK